MVEAMAQNDSPEERAVRRRDLARQIEEQVSKLSSVHEDLQKLVEELREESSE